MKVEGLEKVLERWIELKSSDMTASVAQVAQEQSEVVPAIDHEVFASLLEFDDPDGQHSEEGLVDMTVKSAVTSHAELRVAVKDQDLPRIAFLAHKLKGVVSLLGAVEMTSLCVELENAVTGGESARIQELAEEIEHEFKRVSAAVEMEQRNLPGKVPTPPGQGSGAD